MDKDTLIATLEVVIKTNPATVGTWTVEPEDDAVFLVWRCYADESSLSDMYGDEPWSEWGGDKIMADAGAQEFDDIGCYDGTDYGREYVSQCVVWYF